MSKKPPRRRTGRRPRRVWILAAVIAAAAAAVSSVVAVRQTADTQTVFTQEVPDYIDVQLLSVNAYSRPGIALDEVSGIVIHYTANPGTSAQENRDYFESLAVSQETKVSAHFVIGIDGEVIQCIPTTEMAYASNDRNTDTLSIECCHESADGSFTNATYDSLVELTAWLCWRFGLSAEDVIRHYDVTGKDCPKYFVEHEDAWNTFKKDVQAMIDENS